MHMQKKMCLFVELILYTHLLSPFVRPVEHTEKNQTKERDEGILYCSSDFIRKAHNTPDSSSDTSFCKLVTAVAELFVTPQLGYRPDIDQPSNSKNVSHPASTQDSTKL